MIEQETIRLAKSDGQSILLWAERLRRIRKIGCHVILKSVSEPAPEGSELQPDSFVLIIQTPYQKESWRKHGNQYAGIDATHNTTQCENMSLFTLLVRDRWGHGLLFVLLLVLDPVYYSQTHPFLLSNVPVNSYAPCSSRDHRSRAIPRQIPRPIQRQWGDNPRPSLSNINLGPPWIRPTSRA